MARRRDLAPHPGTMSDPNRRGRDQATTETDSADSELVGDRQEVLELVRHAFAARVHEERAQGDAHEASPFTTTPKDRHQLEQCIQFLEALHESTLGAAPSSPQRSGTPPKAAAKGSRPPHSHNRGNHQEDFAVDVYHANLAGQDARGLDLSPGARETPGHDHYDSHKRDELSVSHLPAGLAGARDPNVRSGPPVLGHPQGRGAVSRRPPGRAGSERRTDAFDVAPEAALGEHHNLHTHGVHDGFVEIEHRSSDPTWPLELRGNTTGFDAPRVAPKAKNETPYADDRAVDPKENFCGSDPDYQSRHASAQQSHAPAPAAETRRTEALQLVDVISILRAVVDGASSREHPTHLPNASPMANRDGSTAATGTVPSEAMTEVLSRLRETLLSSQQWERDAKKARLEMKRAQDKVVSLQRSLQHRGEALEQKDVDLVACGDKIATQAVKISTCKEKIRHLTAELGEKDGAIKTLELTCTERGEAIDQLKARIKVHTRDLQKRNAQIRGLEAAIDERDAQIQYLKDEYSRRFRGLEDKSRRLVAERDAEISRQKTTIDERDVHIRGLVAAIAERDARIEALKVDFSRQRADLRATINERDAQIEALEVDFSRQRADLGATIDTHVTTIRHRDAKITSQLATIRERNATIDSQVADIEELQGEKAAALSRAQESSKELMKHFTSNTDGFVHGSAYPAPYELRRRFVALERTTKYNANAGLKGLLDLERAAQAEGLDPSSPNYMSAIVQGGADDRTAFLYNVFVGAYAWAVRKRDYFLREVGVALELGEPPKAKGPVHSFVLSFLQSNYQSPRVFDKDRAIQDVMDVHAAAITEGASHPNPDARGYLGDIDMFFKEAVELAWAISICRPPIVPFAAGGPDARYTKWPGLTGAVSVDPVVQMKKRTRPFDIRPFPSEQRPA